MEIDPQDSLVTSTEDIMRTDFAINSGLNSFLCKPIKSVKKKRFKDDTDQFPWLHSFIKLYRSMLGSISMRLLLNLITVYTEHVSKDVAASYSKPNRAAKLKRNMIDAIVLFHNSYTSIKTPLDDSVYMEKMSDLLTMYIDMEIKASRRGKESVKKITSKLISSLFIVLNNSSEYIVDTILKARFTVKRYREICIPILKRVSLLAEPQEEIYVRCLLVMKLWKRLLPRGEERNSINRLAVARLGTPPRALLDSLAVGSQLASVLPPLPANKKPALLTRFFMVSKLNLRESIKAFLKITSDLKLDELTTTLVSSRFFDDPTDQVKDHNFMGAIWENITDFTSKVSDNASVDTILSFKTSKLLTTEKRSKDKHKTEAVQKIKAKKINKASDIGSDQTVRLTRVNEKGFIHNFPSDISKRVKLDNDVKGDNDKLRTRDNNKLSPSNTLSDEKPSNFNFNLLTTNLESLSVKKKLGEDCSTNERDINYKVNDDNSTSKKDMKPKKISDLSTGFEKCLELQSLHSCETSNSKEEEETIDKLQPVQVLSTYFSKEKFFNLDQATTLDVQDAEDDTSHEFSAENTNICFEHMGNESLSHLAVETKSKKPTNSTNSKFNTSPAQNTSTNKHHDEEDHFSVLNKDTLKDNGKSNLCSSSLNNNILKIGFNDLTEGFAEKIVPSNKTPNFSKSNLENCSNTGNNNNLPINNSELNQTSSVIDKCVLKTEPSNMAYMFEVEKLRSPRHTNSTEYKPVVIKSENDFKECDKRKAVKSCSVIVKKELANCEQNKDLSINVEESRTEREHDLEPPFQDNCSKDQLNYNHASSYLNNENIELGQTTKKDACLLHKILGEGVCPKSPSKCPKSNVSVFAKSSNVHSNKNSQDIKLTHQQLGSQPISSIILSDWNSSATSIKQEKDHDIFDTGHVLELNKTNSNTDTRKLNDYMPSLPKENEFSQDEYHLVSANDYCSESDDSNLVIDEDLCYIKDENFDEKLFGTNSELLPPSEIKGSLNNQSPTILNEMNKPLLRINDNLLKANLFYSKVESSNDQLIPEFMKHSIYFTEPQPQIIGETSNNVSLQAAVSGTDEHTTSNNSNGNNSSFVPTNQFSNFNPALECKSDLEIDMRPNYAPPYQTNVSKITKSNQIPSTDSNKYLIKINQNVNAKTHSTSNILQNSKPMLETTNKAEGCPFSKNHSHLTNNQTASNFQNSHEQEPLVNMINSSNLSTRIAKNHSQDKSTQYFDVESKQYLLCSQSPTLQTNDNIEIKKDMAKQLRNLKNRTPLSNENLNQFVQHYHTSYTELPPAKPNHETSIHSKSEEKLNIEVHANTQGTSLKYASQEIVESLNKDYGKNTVNVYYNQGLTCNQTSLKRKYQVTEPQEKFAPDIFYKTIPKSDPLCLVMKNNEESKEASEFEFNIFPVAHEVEICSASDSQGGEWTCTSSSEIGHPDWPIANEQSVIDSSNSLSLSSTIDQSNYPLQVQSDLGCGLSEDDPNSLFNSLELQQVSVDFNSTKHVKNRLSKEKLNLHIKTLEVDYNLCCSQRKFKEFYLSQNVPPAIPVPFPPQGRTENLSKSSVRCTCDQCTDNHQKLLSNYNILTHFRNSKVKPANVSNRISDAVCDKDQICDQDCSLPLKKRKTLTSSKLSEEPTMMSYPNTPMISIAQLELAEFNQQTQVIAPNLQPWQNVDSSASTQNCILPDYSSLKYIEPKSNKYSLRKPSKRRKTSR